MSEPDFPGVPLHQTEDEPVPLHQVHPDTIPPPAADLDAITSKSEPFEVTRARIRDEVISQIRERAHAFATDRSDEWRHAHAPVLRELADYLEQLP